MQIKIKDKKLSIDEEKITGIIGNDINYLNNINELIYKGNKNIGLISIKEAYDNSSENVKSFIIENSKIDSLDDILKMVGLNKSILDKDMSMLSTSEKILVMFSKVLLLNPKVILVDNVLSKLDFKLRDKIIKLLIKLKKFNNKTILVSSVDVDIIFEFIDNIIIFDDNKCTLSLNKYDAYDSIDSCIDKPLVIQITNKVLNKGGIKLGNNDSINELIKAIYREIR